MHEQIREVEALAAILRLAYSGELAAALAYRGSLEVGGSEIPMSGAQSVRSRRRNGTNRDLVGGMPPRSALTPPRPASDEPGGGTYARAALSPCGWLAPMYGAGRLERRNIVSTRPQRASRWEPAGRARGLSAHDGPKSSGT